MTDSGSDFSQAKVGDRLWLRCNDYDGRVIVADIDTTAVWIDDEDKPDVPRRYRTNLNGRFCGDGPQVLFWDKVEIVPPPRPRRLVKKTVEVRPYRTMDNVTMVHHTHFDLDDLRMGWKWCGPAQPIEIEVWED